MGRFYETTKSDFVDNKMFELPVDMMYKALQTKDKAVDDTISSSINLLDKLKANVYQSDAPRANEIIQQKTAAIDDIVAGIQKSPGDYNKFAGSIRNLQRDINNSFLQPTGEIYLMEKNNKEIIDQMKAIKDKHKDDAGYAEAEITALKNSYDKGLQYDGTSRQGSGKPAIVQTYELKHTLDDFLKTKLEANEWEVEKDSRTGTGYIVRDKNSREVLDRNKIGNAYNEYFKAHQDIQSAVARRKEIGVEGFENADLGKSVQFGEDGNITGIGNDWYGRNIRGAIANMEYTKTKNSKTLSNDEPYWKQAGWAREDAEKQAPEQAGFTYEGVYQVDANSAGTFRKALGNANVGLAESYKAILSASGISPTSTLGKQILGGNSHAIEAALQKAEPATAQQLRNTYSGFRTQKNFLNAQADGFKAFAKTKGFNVDTSSGNWLNPNTQKMYNDYIQTTGSVGKNNVTSNLVTMNKLGLTKDESKQVTDMVKQNFDDMSFNVDQTVKGSFLSFEKGDGNKVIYVPRGWSYKDKNGKELKANESGIDVTVTKGSKKHVVNYRTAPGGMLSVQSLIREGLVKSQKDAKGNVIMTTRDNGKNVGIVPDETTLGLDQSLDNGGRSNYGMTMQVGDYRVPVLFPTTSLNIPKGNRYVSENYDDLQFNQFMKKTNLNTLGRATAPAPNGATFMTEKGKAYVVNSDGTKQEVTAPEQKREIYKIIFAEN